MCEPTGRAPLRRRYDRAVLGLSEFVRLVVDPTRLAVLGRAAIGPVDLEELGAALGVPQREVLAAAGRLRAAGLVDEDYRLVPVAIRDLARALPRPGSGDEGAPGVWDAGEEEILGRFFSGGRLVSIPTMRAKRLVVLERLAQEFDPGIRYAEPEVNFTLQMFHADYASLRRYLVDEGLLTRAEGVYWRTGGRYEPSVPDAADE